MRKFLMAAAAAIGAVMLTTAAAFAGPITGTFNIQGSATFDGTTVTFANPASSLGPNTGDFAIFGTCVGCVTMTTPLTYNPFTPGLAYTATNLGITTTFTMLGNISVQTLANTLIIRDSGTVTLTGFDPTPGEWVFTANQFGVSGSFSSTTIATAVPEPASLALLGAGLFALGIVRRRRYRG